LENPCRRDHHFKMIFGDRGVATLWAELWTQHSGCLFGRDNKALVCLWRWIYWPEYERELFVFCLLGFKFLVNTTWCVL